MVKAGQGIIKTGMPGNIGIQSDTQVSDTILVSR